MNAKYGGSDGCWLTGDIPVGARTGALDDIVADFLQKMGKPKYADCPVTWEYMGVPIVTERGIVDVMPLLDKPEIGRDTEGMYDDDDDDEDYDESESNPFAEGLPRMPTPVFPKVNGEYDDGSEWGDPYGPNVFRMIVVPAPNGDKNEFIITIGKGDVMFASYTMAATNMRNGIRDMIDYLCDAQETEGMDRIPSLAWSFDDPSFDLAVRAEHDWVDTYQHMMFILHMCISPMTPDDLAHLL